MARRSSRFSHTEAPLLELSMESTNKVQQQGLDEGWTLIECLSKIEVLKPETKEWTQGKVLGFSIPEATFKQDEYESMFKKVESLAEEFYLSAPKSVAHYGKWILVEIIQEKDSISHYWFLYDQAMTVVRPLKDQKIKEDSLFTLDLNSSTCLGNSDRAASNKKKETNGIHISAEKNNHSGKKRKRSKSYTEIEMSTILKKTSSKLDRPSSEQKKEIEQVLNFLDLVSPKKFNQLLLNLQLTLVDAFREAVFGKPETVATTALYSYTACRDMQRSSVQEAGKLLTKWYEVKISELGFTVEEYEEKHLFKDGMKKEKPTENLSPRRSKKRGKSVDTNGVNENQSLITPKRNVKSKVLFSEKKDIKLIPHREDDIQIKLAQSSKKAVDYELYDVSKWKYETIDCSEIDSTAIVIETFLVLVDNEHITMPVGKFTTEETAIKAGNFAVAEAKEYARARIYGSSDSRGTNNDNKTIYKNLRRVIPGRVRRSLDEEAIVLEPSTSRNEVSTPNTRSRNLRSSDNKNSALPRLRRSRTPNRNFGSVFEREQELVFGRPKSNFGVLKYPKGSRKDEFSVKVSYGKFDRVDEHLVQWNSDGYYCGNVLHYTSFHFIDDPKISYQLLDYVLVLRTDREDSEVASAKNEQRYTFSVGQIEAMFVDLKEKNNIKPQVRLSWFYSMKEVKMSAEELEKVRGAQSEKIPELFSSSDEDNQPLTSIIAKLTIMPLASLEEQVSMGTLPEHYLFNKELFESFTLSCSNGGLHEEVAEEQKLRTKRKEMRLHYRNFCPPDGFPVLGVSHHYDSRYNTVIGLSHPRRKEFKGEDPFVAPFALLSLTNLELKPYFKKSDYEKVIKNGSHAVIDLFFLRMSPGSDRKLITCSLYQKELAAAKRDLDLQLKKCEECSICGALLSLKPKVVSVVNNNCLLCIDCFSENRQGLLHTVQPDVEIIHRTDHSYKVVLPSLQFKYPELGIVALKHVCNTSGLSISDVEYVPINFVRGPLPRKLCRAVSTRYLFGVKISLITPGKQKIKTVTVASTIFGKTVEEAKGLAAIEALSQLFGVKTNHHIPFLPPSFEALNSDSLQLSLMSCFDVGKLLESISRYGLAWDSATNVVSSKKLSNLDLKNYYNEIFLPAFFAEVEQRELMRAGSTALMSVRRQYEDSDLFPEVDIPQTKQAIEEAILWARSVKKFLLRRSKLSRLSNRGISFAVVNKSTVFQPRPESFGSFTTPETKDLELLHFRCKELLNQVAVGSKFNALEVKEALNIIAKLKFDQPLDVNLQNGHQSGLSKRMKTFCEVCCEDSNPKSILLCDGCDAEYHVSCLPVEHRPSSGQQFFCTKCLDDRSYLYDHTSWGKSGKILSEIADKTLFESVDKLKSFLSYNFEVDLETPEGETGDKKLLESVGDGKLISTNSLAAVEDIAAETALPLPSVRREWKDNDSVLKEAAAAAIQAGWGSDISSPGTKASEKPRTTIKRQTSMTTPIHSMAKKKKLEITKRLEMDRELLTTVNWATRHFADTEIRNLESANQGLALALLEVTEQRNALLKLLLKLSPKDLPLKE